MSDVDRHDEERSGPAESVSGATAGSAPSDRAPVERLARLFVRGEHGYAVLPTATSAAARRIDATRPARSIMTLVPILELAEIPLAHLDDERLRGWAVLTRAVATLAGTGGRPIAHRTRRTGAVIAASGYTESRLARLLTARGDALPAQFARLSRFLATAGAVPLDLRPLAELVLHDRCDPARADRARLDIARGFYTAPPSDRTATDPARFPSPTRRPMT